MEQIEQARSKSCMDNPKYKQNEVGDWEPVDSKESDAEEAKKESLQSVYVKAKHVGTASKKLVGAKKIEFSTRTVQADDGKSKVQTPKPIVEQPEKTGKQQKSPK